MEQETKIEEVNNEDFEPSENYESICSSRVLKRMGILAGIGGAVLGAYTLYKKFKKEKPIDVECEEEVGSDVVVEEQVSEPEEESE